MSMTNAGIRSAKIQSATNCAVLVTHVAKQFSDLMFILDTRVGDQPTRDSMGYQTAKSSTDQLTAYCNNDLVAASAAAAALDPTAANFAAQADAIEQKLVAARSFVDAYSDSFHQLFKSITSILAIRPPAPR